MGTYDPDYYRRNRERLLADHKLYREANREKVRVAAAAKRARTKDQIRDRDRRYREQKGAELAAKKAAYAKRNRDKINARTRAWLQANPDKGQGYHRAWVERGGERVRQIRLDGCHRRNARLRGATVQRISPTEWKQIKADQGYRCSYCGKQSRRLERDHFEALAAGGAHGPENVVPACRRCNASKSDTSYLVWLAQDGRALWRSTEYRAA